MRAAGIDGIGLLLEPYRLDAWSTRVPCGDCKRHWDEWRKANPADLSSPAAYFAWTVAAHNAVNRRLGKPEMSVDDARTLYAAGS
jgi:hypothetical protein